MENSLQRMKELVEKLDQAAKAYYQEDREIMSNQEYDDLYDQLDQLEKETEYAIRELEKDFHEKRKLYRSMGILGGIFVAVLFW